MFTSGLVWIFQERRIALFFTGCKHAGENLAEVMKQRSPGLPPAIQMCDALSRNVPKPLATLLANCKAHSRRSLVKATPNLPEECRFVLETLGEVYGYDEVAREQGMSPEERLGVHQEHSGPVMERLRTWCRTQLEERKVEPNSGLGEAISYLLKHWEPVTLFLRKAGAPLDNNIVERALKKAILHRKNSSCSGTTKSCSKTPRSGCRGTTVRRSSGLEHDEACLAGKDRLRPDGLGFPERSITPAFWPPTKLAEDVRG